MELTVLGCSGSFNGPKGGACSGYLVRSGETSIWLDCGNGTFGHLQQHIAAEDLTAVVVTHEHPDHCVDIYGLHVLMRYGLEREGLPVIAPEGLAEHLGQLVGGDWGNAFAWQGIDETECVSIGDIGLRFSRTDHPPPTYAVEASASGKRLVYTSDTGPGWSVDAFDRRRRPRAVGSDLSPRTRSPSRSTSRRARPVSRRGLRGRGVSCSPTSGHASTRISSSTRAPMRSDRSLVLAAPHLLTRV